MGIGLTEAIMLVTIYSLLNQRIVKQSKRRNKRILLNM